MQSGGWKRKAFIMKTKRCFFELSILTLAQKPLGRMKSTLSGNLPF